MIKVRGIDAVYFIVKDYAKINTFYSNLLGPPEMVQPGAFCEWTFADGTSFGVYAAEDAKVGTSGSVMFAVDDLSAAVAEAKKHGATFKSEETMETPNCHMVFGDDPEGNEFFFHKRKSAA